MAEDDGGDKTEAPTPRRRQEAREQGNIARSPDLTAAVLLITVFKLLDSYGSGLFKALRGLVERGLSFGKSVSVTPDDITSKFGHDAATVARAIWPLFVGVLIAALVANIFQTGLYFSTKKLEPNIAALNPFRGLSKMFSGGQGATRFVMGLLKVVLVSLMVYSAVHKKIVEIVLIQQMSFTEIFSLAMSIIYNICIRVGVLLLVLALLDYFYQKFQIEKQLKMSKQEVKEEMKRMDGDPHMKARRKQVAMAQIRERLKNDVPKADVVVTNPTEFAIALKYDPSNMHAPRVVAKGQGYIAARIRELAIANGIPILERKPLARALYKMCNVGQEIPEQFYSAVAEILAYVYELGGKLKQKEREYMAARS